MYSSYSASDLQMVLMRIMQLVKLLTLPANDLNVCFATGSQSIMRSYVSVQNHSVGGGVCSMLTV